MTQAYVEQVKKMLQYHTAMGNEDMTEVLSARVRKYEGKLTFNDLSFGPHESGKGIRAYMTFPNGQWISVIQGPGFYSGETSYEVLAPDYRKKNLESIRGWQSPEKITRLMRRLQKK